MFLGLVIVPNDCFMNLECLFITHNILHVIYLVIYNPSIDDYHFLFQMSKSAASDQSRINLLDSKDVSAQASVSPFLVTYVFLSNKISW